MIDTVTKIYTTNYSGTQILELKVTYSDGSIWHVPEDSNNRIYREIQEWAKIEGNNIIDNPPE